MARRSRNRRSCGWPSAGGEGHAGGTFEPPGGGQPCEGRGPNRRRFGIAHLEVVRVPREGLAAVFVDEQEVLEAHPADARQALDAGLDGDDVAGDELVLAREPEPRRLVHLEADAVTEPEVEALREHLPGLARALGGLPGGLDDVAGDVVERAPGHARADRGARGLERFAHDVAQGGDLGAHGPVDEGPRHVGPAARGLVARPEVDHDRQVGRERARPRVVAATGVQRADHDVGRGRGAMGRALGADSRADLLGGQPQVLAVALGPADELLGALHPRLRGVLRAADALELGVALDAAPGLDRLRVDVDVHAFVAQSVGDRDGQVGRDDRRVDAPAAQRPDRDLELGVVARHALLDELVEPELADVEQLGVGQHLRDALRLERIGEDELVAVAGHEKERVDDLERDLVAQGGVTDRVAVEQDRRHALILPERGRTRPVKASLDECSIPGLLTLPRVSGRMARMSFLPRSRRSRPLMSCLTLAGVLLVALFATCGQAFGATVSSSPQGNWVDAFGSDGYALAAWNGGGTSDLTSGLSVTLTHGSRWESSHDAGGDVRALQAPDKSTRRAATWYDSNSLQVRVDFPSAYNGTMHLYALDWASAGRREEISVAGQTATLNSDFSQGKWVNVPINVPAGGSLT